VGIEVSFGLIGSVDMVFAVSDMAVLSGNHIGGTLIKMASNEGFDMVDMVIF
jgi:hypothetical protein